MSLRTKLFLSFASVILLALVLAGAASIVLRWRERQQATLDRLAVAAPQISLDILRLQAQGTGNDAVTQYVRDEAKRQDVRVLIIDRGGTVTTDTGEALRGKRLDVPADATERRLGYRTWEGQGPDQSGLIFLSPGIGLERRFGPARGAGPGPAPTGSRLPTDTVVLAVPRQTVANAWRGLLPGLAWAGLIALALSAVVAVLLARSIARPLQALTRASEEMARGNYDQEIPLRRNDEVGRLAQAFNAMARQVGRSHVQMRALVANVSHDLKTPLTSIIGFAQALRDGAVEGREQTAETGAIIHDEAQRVRSLVDDLLFLSEIEAGEVVVMREPVDVGALAARAGRRFEPALAERGIDLAAALPDGLVVQGDAAKLERVLDNLLDNARKYTAESGRVELRGRQLPGVRPRVRLEVFNTGSYIAPEDLPRVFDRFARLDRARTRASGSGLGLAIAKELAELHGGTLTAASDSAGTTFALVLPVDLSPSPSPQAEGSLIRGDSGAAWVFAPSGSGSEQRRSPQAPGTPSL